MFPKSKAKFMSMPSLYLAVPLISLSIAALLLTLLPSRLSISYRVMALWGVVVVFGITCYGIMYYPQFGLYMMWVLIGYASLGWLRAIFWPGEMVWFYTTVAVLSTALMLIIILVAPLLIQNGLPL